MIGRIQFRLFLCFLETHPIELALKLPCLARTVGVRHDLYRGVSVL